MMTSRIGRLFSDDVERSKLGALLFSDDDVERRPAGADQKKRKKSTCGPPAAKRSRSSKAVVSSRRAQEKEEEEDQEEDAAHAERHPAYRDDCARCRWRRYGKGWQRAVGSHFYIMGKATKSNVWLQPRPPHLGGEWGVGCAFCHHALMKGVLAKTEEKQLAKGRTGDRYAYSCTKWARYEIRGVHSLQSSAARLHAQSAVHKQAVETFLLPELPPWLALASGEDRELLKGSVPQLQDWLRAWRVLRSPTSFRRAAQFSFTETYARREPVSFSNKALKKMAIIMHHCVQEERADILRAAKSISVALDDRGAHRVLRYRCCTLTGDVKTGVLGAVTRRHGSLNDLEEDHSVAAATDIRKCIEKVALGDASLVDHIRDHIHTVAADGCAHAQKTLRLLREQLPNIKLVLRDVCHAIRVLRSVVN